MAELPRSVEAAVTRRFEENFRERGELGASLSIWKDGVEALSLSHGHANRDGTEPWTSETLVPVWSATKSPAAVACLVAAHVSHERGNTAVRIDDQLPASRRFPWA